MSEDKSSYYKISSIVDDFLDDNELHNSWYQKSLKWAYKALRNIRLNVFQQPKTLLLQVTERKTIVLPGDFVDWTKIAVKKGQYAITLAVNDDLTTNQRGENEDTIRGLLSQHMPNGTDFSGYAGYSLLNYNSGSLFSVGGGLPSKGFFKVVDRGECKEIILDYDYNYSQVYVEYISDGIDPCEETIVHPYEYNYIFAYMEMRYEKKNNPKATNFTKSEAERDVYFEGLQLKAMYNNLDPKTFIAMSRSESRLTTKL